VVETVLVAKNRRGCCQLRVGVQEALAIRRLAIAFRTEIIADDLVEQFLGVERKSKGVGKWTSLASHLLQQFAEPFQPVAAPRDGGFGPVNSTASRQRAGRAGGASR